jgi:hydroxylamine reductase
MKLEKQIITGDIMLAELVDKYPKLADVLVEDYGFHCIGCYASGMETLAEGAEVHGMSKEQIKEMVMDLNTLAAKA